MSHELRTPLNAIIGFGQVLDPQLLTVSQHEEVDIPVVVLSADVSVKQIEALRDAGACGYITKPLDVQRFLEVLAANLNGPEHRTLPAVTRGS